MSRLYFNIPVLLALLTGVIPMQYAYANNCDNAKIVIQNNTGGNSGISSTVYYYVVPASNSGEITGAPLGTSSAPIELKSNSAVTFTSSSNFAQGNIYFTTTPGKAGTAYGKYYYNWTLGACSTEQAGSESGGGLNVSYTYPQNHQETFTVVNSN